MSRRRIKVVAAVLATISVAILTGCGASEGSNIAGTPAGLYGYGAGQVQLGQAISFTGTNVVYAPGTMPGSGVIKAGTIFSASLEPSFSTPGTFGTTVVGSAAAMPTNNYGYGNGYGYGYGYNGGTVQTQGVEGSIQMNVQLVNGNYQQGGTIPANVTGTVQISSYIQQQILQTAMTNNWWGYYNNNIMPMNGYYPNNYPNTYPNANAQQIYVNGIALSGNVYLQSGVFQGLVEFYLLAPGAQNPQHTTYISIR